MRILQLTPYFPPYIGGQERYVQNLCSHLVKLGHEVDVATTNYPTSNPIETQNGFSVYRFTCVSRPLRNPIAPALFRLGKIIDSYDVVHTHNEHTFSAFVAWYLALKHKLPLVITCHGQLKFGNPFLDMVEKFYSRAIACQILRGASAVCANSEMDRDYLLDLGQLDSNKVQVVSNAIDPDQLSMSICGGFRDEVKEVCEEEGRKILFVGRLGKRKGLESLVRAMAKVAKNTSLNDVNLVLVGDGEEREPLRSLIGNLGIRDRVRILGQVNDGELQSLYRSSNIFALPSLSEVCPTVVLEAMFHGLPVITTDIPGIKDHFRDTAWLVPPHDTDALANSITMLAQNDHLSDWMRKEGREVVLRKYTWDKVASKYESIFNCVTGWRKNTYRRGGPIEQSIADVI